MRSLLPILLALVGLACGATDAGGGGTSPRTAPLPAFAGRADFLLPPVPEADGAPNPEDAPAATETVLFGRTDGTLRIGLDHGWLSEPDRLEVEDDRIVLEWGQALGPDVGWHHRSIDRLVLVPLDTDGDRVADRLRGTFTGEAHHFELDYYDEVRPFTATVEAPIVPAVPGELTVTPAEPWPTDALEAAFDSSVELVEVHAVDGAERIPLAASAGGKRFTLTPAVPLPWGRTLSVEATVRPAIGGEPVVRSAEVEVTRKPGPWVPSWDDREDPLLGFKWRGHMSVSSERDEVAPLHGERSLLVENGDFALLFAVEVPDVPAPRLVVDARFLYRSFDEWSATPAVELVVGGATGWYRDFQNAFDLAETWEDGPWAGASVVRRLEIDLAPLRATSAVAVLRGRTGASTEPYDGLPPAADGKLQLDGLRIVEASAR